MSEVASLRGLRSTALVPWLLALGVWLACWTSIDVESLGWSALVAWALRMECLGGFLKTLGDAEQVKKTENGEGAAVFGEDVPPTYARGEGEHARNLVAIWRILLKTYGRMVVQWMKWACLQNFRDLDVREELESCWLYKGEGRGLEKTLVESWMFWGEWGAWDKKTLDLSVI